VEAVHVLAVSVELIGVDEVREHERRPAHLLEQTVDRGDRRRVVVAAGGVRRGSTTVLPLPRRAWVARRATG